MIQRRSFITLLGSAAAWPLVAQAQQNTSPVIGYLDFFGPAPKSPAVEAFRAGLAEQGFVEGRNLFIEYRSAGGNSRLLPELTTDLVRRRVSVIVGSRCRRPGPRCQGRHLYHPDRLPIRRRSSDTWSSCQS